MPPLDIDLYLWPLRGDEAAPSGAVLSVEEEARAARFVQPRHAAEFRAARSGLRRVLGDCTGQRPDRLRFHYGPQGKPALDGGPAFNLSHSGGWAALCVGPAGAELGLDIEAHRPVEPAVAERFFAPAEIAALAGLQGTAWVQGFFRLWTRKEALIKALGSGLSCPLDSFDMTAGAEPRLTRLEGGRPEEWTMIDLAPGPAMAGALAVRAHGAAVAIRLREGRLPLGG